jgi:hypothetical protein
MRGGRFGLLFGVQLLSLHPELLLYNSGVFFMIPNKILIYCNVCYISA